MNTASAMGVRQDTGDETAGRRSSDAGRLAGEYQRHGAGVRRALARNGVPPRDLDDLCHDVFVIAAEKIPPLASHPSAWPWFREVAWRVAIAYHRSSPQRRERLVADPSAADRDGALVCGMDDRAPDLLRLLDAVGTLPWPERDALALSALGDLSIAEVARLLGVDRKTARTRIARAQRRVRARLAPPGERPGAARSPTQSGRPVVR